MVIFSILLALLTGFIILMSSEVRRINARAKEQQHEIVELKAQAFEFQNRCAGCVNARFESVNE